jgi:hypothetical protein
MQGTRAFRAVLTTLIAVGLGACHGGGSARGGAAGTPRVDAKAACAALTDLQRSRAALDGVDISDPAGSLDALTKAIDAYNAALSNFEDVAPVSLRPHAELVRTAVVARHFSEAEVARKPIDAWARRNCST